jgi:hypothetical protein
MKYRMKQLLSFLMGTLTFFVLCTLQYFGVALITGLLPVSLAGWSVLITWGVFGLSLLPTAILHLTVAVYVWASVYSMLLRPQQPFLKYRNAAAKQSGHEQNKD